jgi:hypothetical protein
MNGRRSRRRSIRCAGIDDERASIGRTAAPRLGRRTARNEQEEQRAATHFRHNVASASFVATTSPTVLFIDTGTHRTGRGAEHRRARVGAEASSDVVFVAYEGCNLRVLDGCSDESVKGSLGSYGAVDCTSGSVETIDIANEGELYAKWSTAHSTPRPNRVWRAHVSHVPAIARRPSSSSLRERRPPLK